MRGRRRHCCPPPVGRSGPKRPKTLGELVRLPTRSPIAPELERALAAASRLHLLITDLEPVPVRPTITTTEAGAYRFVRRDPVDVRVSRRSGRVASGFLHELGHFVDHQLGWASADHPALAEWRDAAARLERASFAASRRIMRYFDSTRELWARSYAQTVLLRCRDPVLEDQLEDLQRQRDAYVWSAAAFDPVAHEVERAFERLGLTAFPLPLAA